jgi:hypothetical protein
MKVYGTAVVFNIIPANIYLAPINLSDIIDVVEALTKA